MSISTAPDSAQTDAPPAETAATTPPGKSLLREIIETVLLTVLIYLSVNFATGRFRIEGSSMEPSLHANQYVLVDKLSYKIGNPKRGDVVVFNYPLATERDFIKRVIGLPGETVELRQKRVYINGRPLDEPYVHFMLPPRSEGQEYAAPDVRDQFGPVTVPEGKYFVMGDNRDNSEDSRYWGYLPRDYVKGKALMVYWSYESDREDYEQDGIGATVSGALSVITHFFTRTRWDRLLHQIH